MKYTKEILVNAVSNNHSVRGVLRTLGLKQAGGNHSYISSRIRFFQIDTSHFLGKGSMVGNRHRGGSKKLEWVDILVVNRRNGVREKINKLRRAMLDYGFEHVCSKCGCSDMWNGEKLVLEIDHINGDFVDNRPENLRFLCPNCHSQTDTHSHRSNM